MTGRLSDEDRYLVVRAVDGVQCDYGSVSDVLAAVEAITARAVAEALTEAADAIELERRNLDRLSQVSFATGCYRAERIVRRRIPN